MERLFCDGWMSLISALVAILLCIPTLVILSHLVLPMGDTWHHLVNTVLADYIVNTIILALGIGSLGLFVGTGTAWLCATFDFPGQRIFHWALLLPLAIPTYATAFSYGGLLEFSGPIQTLLRDFLGWSKGDYWFPEVRTVGGAVFVMTFVLYPYVYLLGRAAFLGQARNHDETGRTLGYSAMGVFRKISLPLARPSLMAGCALMLMEALSDFGAVQYLAVDTFTTGVYRTWFALGSPDEAARLASMLLLIIFLVLLIEQKARGKARYYQITGRSQFKEKIKLSKIKAIVAALACFVPLLFGFIVPVGYLFILSIPNWSSLISANFSTYLWNSFSLAALTSVLALMLALSMVYVARLKRSSLNAMAIRVVTLGYGLPGSVIAVGVLIAAAWIDQTIDGLTRQFFDYSTGLLLTGGIGLVIFAYLVRFMAIAINTVLSSMEDLSPRVDEAARSMGASFYRRLREIHMPLLSGGLCTAAILVFVDVMKELPATLILRPFNYDTLAVKAFELASDEALSHSACYALTIVVAGLVPVIFLSRSVQGFGMRPAQLEKKYD